ncbi:NUDIX domain-containing protein [Anaeroselena agilis]|uniref:NUDIX hydrolase n=1 Tax=Anaeroselena agilis TaxID=3063788 RepID=A0ABU3NYZ5_9FIRM|nr:NUDIX hydrolase [Selenomonadales bacterium 4137-cl]
MSRLTEHRLASEIVYNGKILTVRHDRVRLPDGREATRDVVGHPGAVAVVPITATGEIVLVRQYRYPVAKELLEVPAGKLDKGEQPEDCARRELEEETGYRAGRLEHLATFYTAPGFTDEIMHLYLARDLSPTAQNTDGDEFIDIEYYTASQVKKLLADKEIIDAKTIIGLLMAGLGR